MIAETAVLSTSPWSGDQMLFPREHYRMSESPDLQALDMNIASLEAELERASTLSRGEMSSTQLSFASSTSCNTSLAGSECSDEICLDVESDVEALFPVDSDHDYLSSTLLHLLGENTVGETSFNLEGVQEPIDLDDISSLSSLVDLPTDSPNVAQYDSIPSVSAPCSPQPQRKRRNRRQSTSRERRSSSTNSAAFGSQTLQQQQQLHHVSQPHLLHHQKVHATSHTQETVGRITTKPWSRMSSSQQVSMIEDLTKTISNQMGLREQIEVIRIINPAASICSNDTEFVIDLDCLNDEKFERVQEVVRRHRSVRPSSTTGSSSSSSSGVSDCSVESMTKSNRRQTKKQQKAKQREARQRQRKEYRQMMKERRSGLFRQEEVLSLTCSTPAPVQEEDEDIDIL